MPGYDRTGPMGYGPRSGGGFGYCRPRGRGGYGPGSDMDRGFGRSRGGGFFGLRKRRYWNRPWFYREDRLPSAPQEEAALLKEQASRLKPELHALEARLAEIEAGSSEASQVDPE